MKKLTASIIGAILCTSSVLASASTTDFLSKEELLNQLKDKIDSQVVNSFNGLTLEELLNKFGVCINNNQGNNQLPDNEIEKPDINIPENDEESIPEADKSFELQVLELVNIERTSRGLKALSYSDELASVAEAHSQDMAKRNYFSHNTPEGLTPFDRIKNAGITYRSAGENIAAGQQTPEAVVRGWMNSAGHRANILNANYTKMGVGCVYGGSYGIYWTQVFTG